MVSAFAPRTDDRGFKFALALVRVHINRVCSTFQVLFSSTPTRDSVEAAGSKRTLRTGSLESGSLWTHDRDRVGTQALVELGVTTGLGLLFALLKQTWSAAVSKNISYY
jgi:hypothetical protein